MTTQPTARWVATWHCTDQRDGRRVHVDSRRNLINGPSRLVHTGGRLACDDGRVAEDPTTYGREG